MPRRFPSRVHPQALRVAVLLGLLLLASACTRRSLARDADVHLNEVTRTSVELFREFSEIGKPSDAALAAYRQAIERAEVFLGRHRGEAGRPEYSALQEWIGAHKEFARRCSEASLDRESGGTQAGALVKDLNRLLRQGAEVRAMLKRGAGGNAGS